MNILFLHEYAPPFSPGGAEESMMRLATALVRKGHLVRVLTPRYDGAARATIDGVHIVRFPFYCSLKPGRSGVRAFWHTSVLWWAVSIFFTLRYARVLRPDVLHIQGKYSIPAGVIAGKLLGIPTVYTARDYRALCNWGLCISHGNPARRCNLRQYFFWEFPLYVRTYTRATAGAWCKNFLFALRGRVWSSILYFFCKQATQVVGVSRRVAEIYRDSGINGATAVYNLQPSLPSAIDCATPHTEAIFAGKITPGKGGALLPEIITRSCAREPSLRWRVYTGGGLLFDALCRAVMPLVREGRVSIEPYVANAELLARIAAARVVCVPSVWHEPLTRLALEALSVGTPVVLTDRGGSAELVEDGVTGRLVGVDAAALADAVLEVVQNGAAYRARIRQRRGALEARFVREPLENCLALYGRIMRTRALGVILPVGGSLRVLERIGQRSRFMAYLEQYARAFDCVYVFSYEPEEAYDLPEGVRLIAPRRRMHKRLYMLLLPLLQRRWLKVCRVVRVMQMDGALPAIVARLFYGVPFAATFGYRYDEFARVRGQRVLSLVLNAVTSVGVRFARAVIYTTEEIKSHLVERFGSRVADHLVYIPNGVDTQLFAPSAARRDDKLLLFVGRLEPQKNLFALLDAIARLPDFRSLRVRWIGRGTEREALRRRAQELGVALDIVDCVDHARLPEHYAQAGVFTLVSHIEGMPKVLVEAMSAACACVVSNCDGNRILIEEGKTGVLVGTDAASIASGLERVLRDPVLRKRLGGAARAAMIERYDLNRLLTQETDFLRSIGPRRSSFAQKDGL